ncbi:MAG: lasso peptide biosynthesis B2 protein [Anaerolineae bacterium]|nr:lasso peptide biosynthesis B2 protein [Anaerolineae bacterium]MCA9887283.1 lasso peptide biosynthesis B2 protein [Anaerolineae bacterium]MCA9894273.1 lasso peptide biosynthesis B2 protein [Anaerolineae bacterium]
MRRLQRLFALPTHQKLLLAEAWLTQGFVVIALKLLPFRVVWQWMIKPDGSFNEALAPATIEDMYRVAWAVQVAARHMRGAKCLAKALSTYRMLARRGIMVPIKIGVTRDTAGLFAAHAWIEYQGNVIIGDLENLSEYRHIISDGVNMTLSSS